MGLEDNKRLGMDKSLLMAMLGCYLGFVPIQMMEPSISTVEIRMCMEFEVGLMSVGVQVGIDKLIRILEGDKDEERFNADEYMRQYT